MKSDSAHCDLEFAVGGRRGGRREGGREGGKEGSDFDKIYLAGGELIITILEIDLRSLCYLTLYLYTIMLY